MRAMATWALAVGWIGAATAQDAAPPPDRYGVPANLANFPQATPKAALDSVIRAAERGRFEYLVAQLLDPATVDTRVAERARLIEDTVDRELRGRLAEERARPPAGHRLPQDPAGFTQVVQAEARQRAFRLVVREVPQLLAENPTHLRDLRRFARSGVFAEAGDAGGKMTLPDLKEREVLFQRVGERWFVLNGQQALAGK